MESSLEKNKKTFDEDHIHIIVNLSLLAGVYSELGRHEEAIVLAEKAYFSEQKKCDDNHPSLAIRRSKLGLIYKAAGRTNEAMHLMEKSLDSAIINFGENHPTVSIRQAFLGEIYRLLGENDKAFEILDELALMKYQGKLKTLTAGPALSDVSRDLLYDLIESQGTEEIV